MPLKGNGAFSAALLSPDAPVPEGIVDPNGRIAPKRFAVYRNNVIVSLTEALGATFMSIKNLVGEGFFAQVAREFIRQNPPTSPIMAEYGRDFPDYFAALDSVKHLPFIGDLAQTDRAWLDAFHAADAPIVTPESMAAVGPDELSLVRFEKHPATQLVTSQFPLHAIWQATRAGQMPEPGAQPTSVLLTRPDVEVLDFALAGGSVALFAALLDGQALGEAVNAALAADENFDLASALGQVISTGAFTQLHTGI